MASTDSNSIALPKILSNPSTILPPPTRTRRGQSRSPSRSPTRIRITDDILSDLSPATTLEAFTNTSGALKKSIEAATPAQRAFGIRAAVASRRIEEWVEELGGWNWPEENGFEVPQAKRRKTQPTSIDDYNSFGHSRSTDGGTHTTERGRQMDQKRGQADVKDEYWGSLKADDVMRYEGRIEDISEDMDDLNVEEIKRQVLTTHVLPTTTSSLSSSPISPNTPTKSSSYTKMDDLTAVVTATVLRALPNLSRLMALMDVWSVRLLILRQVPVLLLSLEDAELALKSGWDTIVKVGRSKSGPGGDDSPQTLSRETYNIMRSVLQDKVTALGQKLDMMLDALEGRADTLPEEWLDRMEVVEQDYSDWSVTADRKVREGEWALDSLRRKSSRLEMIPEAEINKEPLELDSDETSKAVSESVQPPTQRPTTQDAHANDHQVALSKSDEEKPLHTVPWKSSRMEIVPGINDTNTDLDWDEIWKTVSKDTPPPIQHPFPQNIHSDDHQIVLNKSDGEEILDVVPADVSNALSENEVNVAEPFESSRIVDKHGLNHSLPSEKQKVTQGSEREAPLAEMPSNSVASLPVIADTAFAPAYAEEQLSRGRPALPIPIPSITSFDGTKDTEPSIPLIHLTPRDIPVVITTSQSPRTEQQPAAATHFAQLPPQDLLDKVEQTDSSQEHGFIPTKNLFRRVGSRSASNSPDRADESLRSVADVRATLSVAGSVSKVSDKPTNTFGESIQARSGEVLGAAVVSLPSAATSQVPAVETDEVETPVQPSKTSALPTFAVEIHSMAMTAVETPVEKLKTPSESVGETSVRTVDHTDISQPPTRSMESVSIPPVDLVENSPETSEAKAVEPTPIASKVAKFGRPIANMIRAEPPPSNDETVSSITSDSASWVEVQTEGNLSEPGMSIVNSEISEHMVVPLETDNAKASPTHPHGSSTMDERQLPSPAVSIEPESSEAPLELVQTTSSQNLQLPSKSKHTRQTSTNSAVLGYSVSDPSPEILEASEEYFSPVISPMVSPVVSPTRQEATPTSKEYFGPVIAPMAITLTPRSPHIRPMSTDGSTDNERPQSIFPSRLRAHRPHSLSECDTFDFNDDADAQVEACEPSLDRTQPQDHADDENLDTPSRSARGPLRVQVDNADAESLSSESPLTPTDAPPSFLSNLQIASVDTPVSTKNISEDQLQKQISSILESIPANIKLTTEPPLPVKNPSPSKPRSELVVKKQRPTPPAARPQSRTSSRPTNYSRPPSRAVTPSFTLAPALSSSHPRRSRPQPGNPEIKVYHLSRSTGEAPIKLFVRLVGENGERVMVRVGGGWADLGEYLREYAAHHGRRPDPGKGEVQIRDLPVGGTQRNFSGSSVGARPGSALDGERPRSGSALNVRRTRRTMGEGEEDESFFRKSGSGNGYGAMPGTPASTPAVKAFETPPGATSSPIGYSTPTSARTAAKSSWDDDEGVSLGLAGPKRVGLAREISEVDRRWVEGMKEKVRVASAEKDRERELREREREKMREGQGSRVGIRRISAGSGSADYVVPRELTEMDRVGGTKRLFLKKGGGTGAATSGASGGS